MKRKRLFKLLAAFATVVFVASIVIACGKDDDSDGKNSGGQVIDPDVPVLSDITYELSPNAVLVPEETAKSITNVDTLGHKFTLPLSAEAPVVGQTLIINTPSKELHDGLLAMVLAVEETASGYVVSYRNAELKDAFKEIDIPEQYIPLNDLVEHIYDDEGNEISFSREYITRASGDITYPIVLPEHGWKLGYGLELTPKMTIDMAMRYVFQFADYEADYIGIKVDADITLGADLSFGVKEKDGMNKRLHLFTLVCAAIPIGPVVLTPSINVDGVLKTDGKISIEASISYTRTVHAKMIYQKGKEPEGTCELEPEAEDALKYSFGPKFEGNIYYGLSIGGNIGVFGKTLAVRARLDALKKESISTKLDLVEMAKEEGVASTLLAMTLMPIGSSLYLGAAEIPGMGWNTQAYTDFDYGQAFVYQLGFDFTILGHDVYHVNLPEVTIPTDSRKIIPQFEIDTQKMVNITDEGDATLTLHLKEKSLLGPFTKFRAEWKRVGAPKDESPIVSYFDMTGALTYLEADKSGKGIDIVAKSKLKQGETYTLVVYMNLMAIDFEIFRIEEQAGDVTAVILSGELFCASPTYHEGTPTSLVPVVLAANKFAPDMIKTVRNGKKLHVTCYGIADDEVTVTSKVIASFDIDDVDAVKTKKANIQNLRVDNVFSLYSGDLPSWKDTYSFDIASDIPMTQYITQNDAPPAVSEDDEDLLSIDANYAGVWEIKQPKLSNFSFTKKEWHYKMGELDKIDEHVFSLQNDPDNNITVSVAFK